MSLDRLKIFGEKNNNNNNQLTFLICKMFCFQQSRDWQQQRNTPISNGKKISHLLNVKCTFFPFTFKGFA